MLSPGLIVGVGDGAGKRLMLTMLSWADRRFSGTTAGVPR
jgi:hypothetical protein